MSSDFSSNGCDSIPSCDSRSPLINVPFDDFTSLMNIYVRRQLLCCRYSVKDDLPCRYAPISLRVSEKGLWNRNRRFSLRVRSCCSSVGLSLSTRQAHQHQCQNCRHQIKTGRSFDVKEAIDGVGLYEAGKGIERIQIPTLTLSPTGK